MEWLAIVNRVMTKANDLSRKDWMLWDFYHFIIAYG